MQFRWKRQRATEIEAIPWQWDYSRPGNGPMICVTPTLLGEEKPPFQTRRSRVIAVSCPWLIDALVRAGQQRQYLSSS